MALLPGGWAIAIRAVLLVASIGISTGLQAWRPKALLVTVMKYGLPELLIWWGVVPAEAYGNSTFLPITLIYLPRLDRKMQAAPRLAQSSTAEELPEPNLRGSFCRMNAFAASPIVGDRLFERELSYALV
jgi:hypothetical protein